MKLDRTVNPGTPGKYLIINTRKLGCHPKTVQELVDALLQHPESVDLSGDDEAFVLKLKDLFVPPALFAYAYAAHSHGQNEYAQEVIDLAFKAEVHPSRKQPD